MDNIIKRFLKEDVYFYSILLVLVAVVSFGLGRASLAGVVGQQPAVAVQAVASPVRTVTSDTDTTQDSATMQLVGSKNGTKYHALWCPGASQIKESNKVFFASESEAQAKGYTQAANCDI